jgi:hypothetical protein
LCIFLSEWIRLDAVMFEKLLNFHRCKSIGVRARIW